ncbi:helix-turn-helix transcriptional regulator [Kitasatospora sp. NPDC048722]|uniref:response regulator transcription factor n=1 Tax=Kitasatospora sp. NPDC048722 TaxID=3155639 RepID=UPI0033C0B235
MSGSASWGYGPRAAAETAREQEVALLLVRGCDTREVARTLAMAPYTVQDHLKSLFAETGVASRRELVARIVLGS